MRASAFVYPWDVVGDPDAAQRLARLGVQQVTLASAYHSTRALTPRHPRHRIVTARHSAVLYPPDPARWAHRELRPYAQDWVASADGRPVEDPYGEAARALTEAGLEVHSWVVLAHNSRLGDGRSQITVRNAYGDRYPWAPCVARPEVREYAVTLAAEAAVRPGTGTGGTELESCGWYGLAHLHAHDKTGGVPLDGAGRYLMSLCFCEVCCAGYAELGADPEELRKTVTTALDPLWSGVPAGEAARGTDSGVRAAERTAVRRLLGAEPAEVFAAWRVRSARALRREAVAAVRAEAVRTGVARAAAGAEGRGTGAEAQRPGSTGDFRVLLHADPAAHRTGANAGVDPAEAREDADGVVLPCTGGAAERADVLGPFGAVRPDCAGSGGSCETSGEGNGGGAGAGRGEGRQAGSAAGPSFTVAANLTVVSGMGGSPHTLASDAAHARDLGADELRLYHAGLASDADLAAVEKGLARLE